MAFAVGQHVVVQSDRASFGGVAGVVADPPEWLNDDGGNGRTSPARYEKRRNATVEVYWVEFDLPIEGANEGGPYLAAAIEAESLQPLGNPLTQAVRNEPSMQLVF